MSAYQNLIHKLERGEQLLIDGATGTEIERRGVPMVQDAWNGGGASTHPETVRAVHEVYIRCGAHIIISNTFSTSRHVLQDAGLEAEFELLNRRGVELAQEARDRLDHADVLVAGGITYWSFTGNHPSIDQLRHNIEAQAQIMADAGADLIMLEMMGDVERTTVTLEAAQKTGLPVWVGFSCEIVDGEAMLVHGPSLEEGLAAIQPYGVPLVSIMHTQVEEIDACLDVVAQHWDGLVGVYAHSGRFVNPNWVFNGVISAENYTTAALGWLDRGVQIIGGCCGIGLEHMQSLNAAIQHL